MNKDDLILVSVDDHIIEPPEMFKNHVPDRYRDQAPRVIENDQGRQYWWYGDIRGRITGQNAVAGRPPEEYNSDAYRYDEMRPGCYDVNARVEDMDIGGVLACMNFPNFPGFAGQVLNEGPDAVLNEVMIRAYNDWTLDEWCASHPDRFIPLGIVPYFDPQRAAAEVKRLAEKGCHAITFSERPDALGAPSIFSDHWDPFFAACADSDTVICLHLGSSGMPIEPAPGRPTIVKSSLSPMRSMMTFAEIIWAPFWFKFPTLRVSITEGDIGWLPYFVQRANHALKNSIGWATHPYPPNVTPEMIFHDRLLCCFVEDAVGIQLLDRFNVDNVFWEHDYPHGDSIWPLGPEIVVELMANLDQETIEKITYRNAMRHYQFDPFRWRSKEEATVGALRAKALERQSKIGTFSTGS